MPTTTRAAGGVAQPPTDGGLGAAVPELTTPGHTPAETPSGTSQHSGGRPSPNGGSGEREMNMGYRSPGHQANFNPVQLFDDDDRPIAGTITTQALHDLVNTFMTNEQLVKVINDRIAEEGGVAAGVMDQNIATLNAALEISEDDFFYNPEMKAKVKVMFGNIINSLTKDCASLFEEVFTEILDSLAPKICKHFNLVHHTAATTKLSPAMFTLQQVWSVLAPHYLTLNNIKDKMKANRDLGLVAHSKVQSLEHDAAVNGVDDMEQWGIDSWEKKDIDTVVRGMISAVNDLRVIDPNLNMDDVMNGSSIHEINWEEIAGDTGRSPVDARSKVISIWRDKQIKIFTKQLELTKTHEITLKDQYKATMQIIARIDVRTADAIAEAKVDGLATKAPGLVLNHTALAALKSNPKALLGLSRALTTYFDQYPGTFAVLRIILKFVIDEINSGKTDVEVPMDCNSYMNDLPLSDTFSSFLRIQAQSFMQIVNSTASLTKLVVMTREPRNINELTSNPELFAASDLCFMEFFRWFAMYHGGQAAQYRRQLKAMLENLGGLLSQKKSAEALRQILKEIVIPAKKLLIKLEWTDCIFPIIRALKEQTTSVYFHIISEFERPTADQKTDCIAVLEKLLAKLIAVVESAKLGDTVLLESDTYNAAQVQAVIFTRAYKDMIDSGDEVANSAFVFDVDPIDVFNVDAAGPQDKGKGKGKLKSNGGRGIDPAVEVFMSKNPSVAEAIAFAISAACSNYQRHALVESKQPHNAGVWSCMECDCKGQVSANMKDKLVSLRIHKSSIGNYWKWALCDSHHIQNIFIPVKTKNGDEMYKLGGVGGMKQKALINEGRMGAQAKAILTKFEAQYAGMTPTTTYAIAAAAAPAVQPTVVQPTITTAAVAVTSPPLDQLKQIQLEYEARVKAVLSSQAMIAGVTPTMMVQTQHQEQSISTPPQPISFMTPGATSTHTTGMGGIAGGHGFGSLFQ